MCNKENIRVKKENILIFSRKNDFTIFQFYFKNTIYFNSPNS